MYVQASVTLCDVQLKHELFYELYRLYFTYHQAYGQHQATNFN